MKTIKVLGPGCTKCKNLEKNVRDAVAGLLGDFEVQKIDSLEEMMKYNILSSPALVIDEKLVATGKVLSVSELMDLLKK